MTEWIDALRVAAALGGLAYAAYTDTKTREVPDEVWYGLGFAAFALFAVDLHLTYGGVAWVMAVSVGLVFAVAILGGEFIPIVPGDDPLPDDYTLNDAERGRLRLDLALTGAALAVAFAILVVAGSLDLGRPAGFLQGPQVQAYTGLIMFGLAYLMFFLSLLSGGADAKCLMALAFLFPVAPALAGLPMVDAPALTVLIVPFALAAFFNGALLLVALRVPATLALSVKRGGLKFPQSLGGYPKPLAEINLKREWIQGTVEDGKFKETLLPTHGAHSDERQAEALEFLKRAGEPTVFVTPRLPFMVYLVVGFVALVLVSSPLYFVGGAR